ncbi:hypothetical protein D3273_25265 [Lichenibacterium minor]|uniref:Phage tail lysozyme domain-containing protein n=1 Tax=Lichenibacterium minor TaxID=2316528 RepID=A0A4Q2U2U0_9HYPH|nr:phage tail tip lysozyme [Lichenibacterium minor]RYC29177.1 hypothetical protein D3273_25265 [Lichenibacterium minor]
MADEQLRLVASLKDNASPGVRRIKSELKTIDVAPGMAQAQKWVRGFNEDVAKFKKSSMTVASVMSSMGVGGLAAAGSIGTLAAAFKSLADKTLDMRELGREVGLTADEINAMNRAGQHFGFDPSQMEGAIRHFAGLMPEFKRGYGELNNILARQPDLIKRLKVEDTKTQIKEIFDFLGTIKNPQDRMVFERGIFGTDGVEKLFAEGGNGFEAQAEKFRTTLAPITAQAAAQAQALRDAINDFNAAVENLEMKAGPTVYRWLTAGVKELGAVLTQVEKAPGDVAAAAAVIAGSLVALRVRNRIVRGSALAGGGEMRAAAGQLSAAGGGLDKTAVTLNEAAIALREAAIELRGRGGTPGTGSGGGAPGQGGQPGSSPGFSNLTPGGIFAALQVLDLAGRAPDELRKLQANPDKDAASPEMEFAAKLGDTVRGWFKGGTSPVVPAFHPDDDRLSRARASDMPDRSLDGFVVGSLEKPILHLSGTLRTAARQAEEDGIKPAAFHSGGIVGAAVSDPVAMLAEGTRRGVLAALRELQGGVSADPSTARSGIMPASFGGGGGGGSGGSGGGGNFDTSGGGSTRASGSLAANQREAYAAAIGEGLSKTAARALVADLSGEGLARDAHRVHWDGKHNSGGIAQWDPQRAAAIQRKFGKLPWEMDVAGQTRASIWEYRNNPRFARTKAAMEGSDPGEMIKQLVANYEDPRDKATAIRQRMGYLRGFNPDSDTSGGAVGDALGKLKLARNVVGVQCVALANAAVGFGGSVKEWRRGVSAADGTLKDGTPIATFLNRDGSQSSRYAGGGIGTEGANRDHAAVFRRYLRDEAGKAIGMTVSEQSRGHALHLRNYMFGRGAGEQNGSNYNAIMGPDGRPLGGSSNPMTELRAAAERLGGAARDDLAAEKRRAEDRRQQTAQVDGGIDAHVHLHDHRTSTRVERRGAIRDASITVRRAPQRTSTV